MSTSATHPKSSATLFVDSHVHYYSCFDKFSLISSAVRNVEAAAARLAVSPAVGMLVLVENYGSRDLSRLVSEVQRDRTGPWDAVATNEKSSVAVYREGVRRLVLLEGRQIRTAESLEVLALDCTEDIPDGRPIRETLRAVSSAGAIAVIPWGFGKWWFGRGLLVNRLIEEEAHDLFFLGDNRGRPYLSPRPGQFRRAEEQGRRVLPGTDPLPLPGEEVVVGSYGFVVSGPMDLDRPGESLRRYLQDPAVSPAPYGRGSSWLACLRKQLLLRTAARSS